MPESNAPHESDLDAAAEPAAVAEEDPTASDTEAAPADAELADGLADGEAPAPPMNRAERRGNARRGRQPLPATSGR